MHRASWHDGKLWNVHVTHHKKKSENVYFELNDILGVLNAVAVIPVMFYAFQLPPGPGSVTLLGYTIGVSIYGTAYIVVHDGVHHGRFPTGPLKNISYVKRISDAHTKHHKPSMGVPFGLFLGPQEVEAAAKGNEVAPIPLWLSRTLLFLTSLIMVDICMTKFDKD
mmetsp:Transcript_11968/g.15584  ORF Transcript_11968/g.15584 Transcript_11968/m.15584 type:complete len:166 (-) Transcript_11968:185-682(-)